MGTVAASVLRRAQAAGFKTSVDLVSVESDRFADVVLPALRFCDYCILNELEAERTTGVAIIKEGSVDLSPLEEPLASSSTRACANGSSSTSPPVRSP